jgi:prophage regulatory protein
MATPKKIPVTPIFLDLPTVAEVVALSESTVQELVRKCEFPQPRQLSYRRVGWLMPEVQQWAESRPVSQILPPQNTGVGRPRKEAA